MSSKNVDSIRDAYLALREDPMDSFLVRNMALHSFKHITYQNLHVYPGSFNPLHQGHLAIFESIHDDAHSWSCFEISIYPFGKPEISFDDLLERLEQFNGVGPVVVTSSARFLDKAGILRFANKKEYSGMAMPYVVTFHLGVDTAERLLKDVGVTGVQGIYAKFVVYDRKVGDTVRTLDDLGVKTSNVRRGELKDREHMALSSTKIRESVGGGVEEV